MVFLKKILFYKIKFSYTSFIKEHKTHFMELFNLLIYFLFIYSFPCSGSLKERAKAPCIIYLQGTYSAEKRPMILLLIDFLAKWSVLKKPLRKKISFALFSKKMSYLKKTLINLLAQTFRMLYVRFKKH